MNIIRSKRYSIDRELGEARYFFDTDSLIVWMDPEQKSSVPENDLPQPRSDCRASRPFLQCGAQLSRHIYELLLKSAITGHLRGQELAAKP